MNTVVMKFGGVLVQDAPAIMHSAQLVVQAAHKNIRAVVVVSAMAGVTDGLLELADRARQGHGDEVAQAVDLLERRHEEAVQTVFSSSPAMAVQPVLDEEHALFVSLRQALARASPCCTNSRPVRVISSSRLANAARPPSCPQPFARRA